MKTVKLDLGCGMKKVPDSIGIDVRPFPGVDIVMKLGYDPIPLDDNSVDEIYAIHLFEHFYPEELFQCVDECFRILKPQGFLHIEVPKAGTPAYYIHPDHKIQFMEDTFGFFQVPSEGKDPHGYLNGFWNVSIVKQEYNEHIHVNMYPNKEGGKYEYKKIIQSNIG